MKVKVKISLENLHLLIDMLALADKACGSKGMASITLDMTEADYRSMIQWDRSKYRSISTKDETWFSQKTREDYNKY